MPDEFDDEATDDLAPSDDARRYASLDRALKDQHVPLANHDLIRRVTSAIGISAYHERGNYIRADRAGDGPALHISYGWTSGFVSEAEAEEAAGPGVERWQSERGKDVWGVWHPVNRGYSRDGGGTSARRDHGLCPTCFTELPATKQCDRCEA